MEVFKTYIVKDNNMHVFLFQTICDKYFLQQYTPTGDSWVTDIFEIEKDKAFKLIKNAE